MQIVEHDQRAELECGVDRAAGRTPDHRCGPQLLEGPDIGPVGYLMGQPQMADPVPRDVKRVHPAVRSAGDRGFAERGADRNRFCILETGKRIGA